MKIEVDIERMVSGQVSGTAVIGMYNVNNCLTKANCYNLEWDDNKTFMPAFYFSVPNDASIKEYKFIVFVWDDLLKMHPLMKSAIYSYGNI